MTTSTNGVVDTEVQRAIAMHDYCKIFTDENMGLQYAELKLNELVSGLIRQELEAVRAEIPEKINCKKMCDKHEAHDQAITEMTEKLDKRIEAL